MTSSRSRADRRPDPRRPIREPTRARFPPAIARRSSSLLAFGLAAALVAGCAPGGATPSVPGSPSTRRTGTFLPGPTGTSPGAPETPLPSPVDAAAIGRAFVEALARGDLAVAEAFEDEAMRSQAPAAVLGTIWQQLQGQLGSFEATESVRLVDQPPYRLALVRTRFARSTVDLQVTVDEAGRVAGFFVRPPSEASPGPSGGASPSAVPPAGYVRPEAFAEPEVTVGAEPWALPGTLSMPVGEGSFPAVALVAGSGPQDRDETIGPNKPLRDLAWGLASRGPARRGRPTSCASAASSGWSARASSSCWPPPSMVDLSIFHLAQTFGFEAD